MKGEGLRQVVWYIGRMEGNNGTPICHLGFRVYLGKFEFRDYAKGPRGNSQCWRELGKDVSVWQSDPYIEHSRYMYVYMHQQIRTAITPKPQPLKPKPCIVHMSPTPCSLNPE